MPICTASCSDPTVLLEKMSLLSCDSAADVRDTGEGSLAMVEISGEEAYIVMVVVLAAVVRAAVVEWRLTVVVVEEVRDASKSTVSLCATAMSLSEVNVMLVGGCQEWLRW